MNVTDLEKHIRILHLVYGVFVIRLEFIEGDDMPYGEENEKGGENKGDDIAKSRESERHLHHFYNSLWIVRLLFFLGKKTVVTNYVVTK